MPRQLPLVPSRGCPEARGLCRVPLCHQQRHSPAESASPWAQTSWDQPGSCGGTKAQLSISRGTRDGNLSPESCLSSPWMLQSCTPRTDTSSLQPGFVLRETVSELTVGWKPSSLPSSSSFLSAGGPGESFTRHFTLWPQQSLRASSSRGPILTSLSIQVRPQISALNPAPNTP